jgi:Protein of unknown function (DUF4199)
VKAGFTEGAFNSMKKTVLTFGLISGAMSAALMLVTIPFVDKIGWEKGEIFGYTGIVLSALMVFFGVRSYRENVGAGRITFGRGFAVGVLITLLSSACYVGTWEIVYYKFMPDFAEKYAAHMVERAKASGASQQKIDETERQAKQFKQMYDNPVFNVALTFMEVFPIGVAVTLLSAGILRKKGRDPETKPASAS